MATMNSGTSLGTDALRVVFERQGDRFAHRIFCSRGDDSSAILISQEGKSDDVWPPSPALQSLHLETRPGGAQTIMLVGMAGRSHWSISVESDVERNRLMFDIACRVHDRPAWLGSTYEIAVSEREAWPMNGIVVTARHGDQLGEEIAVQIDRSNGCIRIPVLPVIEAYPQTVCWCYSIELAKKITP
jgi:hypothetical protein